jgi:hypothetical protein
MTTHTVETLNSRELRPSNGRLVKPKWAVTNGRTAFRLVFNPATANRLPLLASARRLATATKAFLQDVATALVAMTGEPTPRPAGYNPTPPMTTAPRASAGGNTQRDQAGDTSSPGRAVLPSTGDISPGWGHITEVSPLGHQSW